MEFQLMSLNEDCFFEIMNNLINVENVRSALNLFTSSKTLLHKFFNSRNNYPDLTLKVLYHKCLCDNLTRSHIKIISNLLFGKPCTSVEQSYAHSLFQNEITRCEKVIDDKYFLQLWQMVSIDHKKALISRIEDRCKCRLNIDDKNLGEDTAIMIIRQLDIHQRFKYGYVIHPMDSFLNVNYNSLSRFTPEQGSIVTAYYKEGNQNNRSPRNVFANYDLNSLRTFLMIIEECQNDPNHSNRAWGFDDCIEDRNMVDRYMSKIQSLIR